MYSLESTFRLGKIRLFLVVISTLYLPNQGSLAEVKQACKRNQKGKQNSKM